MEMIRAEVSTRDIPVIFLTAKGDKESVKSVLSLKPAGYLLKTMDSEQIVENIDQFFEKNKDNPDLDTRLWKPHSHLSSWYYDFKVCI